MNFRSVLWVFLVCFLIGYDLQALPGFERVYGGLNQETANYIQPTKDHGYILVGTGMDPIFGTHSYYVLKLDSTGNEEWSKILGDPLDAFGYAIVQTYDGNFALVGSHVGIFYDGIAEVLLLDSNGSIINSNTFPPSEGWGTAGIGIVQTTDSNLAISTYTDGFISQNYYSLFKLAPDLSTSWTNFLSYDGSMVNVHDVIQQHDGNYFSLGYYDYFYYVFPPIDQATAIRKFASDGTLLVDSVFALYSISNSITATSDSGIMISGYQDSLSRRSIVLTRLNTNATPLWQKSYQAQGFQDGFLVRQTSDGGFAILSTVDGVLLNQHDIQLMKVNANGDSLWSKNYGSYLDERALHFEETSDSGFVILGSTTSYNNSKIYVIKTDSLGEISFPYTVNASGNYFCSGDTALLNLQPSPDPGSQIQWSSGETTDTIKITATGNYTAIVIDQNGDTSRASVFPVFFASLPDALISSQDTLSLCSQSVLENLITGDITLGYQWYLNDTLIPGENTSKILPAFDGKYSLIISNYCGTDTASVYIDTLFQLPDKPSLNAISPATICPSDSFKLAVLDTGFTYQWYADSWSGFQVIQGATDSIIYLHDQNTYLVEITDANGCVAFSDIIFLIVDADPVYVNASGPLSFCIGGQVQLTAPSGTQYLWSTGDTIPDILVSTPGNYFFSMLDLNGCPKSSDTVGVVINPLPFISLGPDTTVCDTGSILLDAGPGFNYYLWQDGSFDQTFLATSPHAGPDSADFYVLVTDTNGCVSGDTLRVTFDICDGLSEVHISDGVVYPNPAECKQGFHLKRSQYNYDSVFCLSDNLGRDVWQANLPQNADIILVPKSINPGLYHFRIQRKNGILVQGTILLQ